MWQDSNDAVAFAFRDAFRPYVPYLERAVDFVPHMFALDGGAESIATIPLSRYSPDASANIIAMFAQWGLSQLLFGLVMLVVVVRYRALVPLMWLLLCLEYAGRQGLGLIKPVHTAGTAPGAAANPLLLLLAVVMLALALWPARIRLR
jgi:hypothetical protein